ncbi:thiamine diphosphokinase [Anaerolentibacter hominis]|uniref:thiamine diphosphokinase n=1 Tax=Anaerolentibacter hominis TaxID=3079009 RepID=UPI0031B86D97
MSRGLILTGGRLNRHFLESYLKTEQFDKIFCVDGALETVEEIGLAVDYLLGDFDSVDPELLDRFRRKVSCGELSTIIQEYNPVKDATDTEIAIDLAAEMGLSELVILGATGSRTDHLLGNISLLKKTLDAGMQAFLLDEYNKIYLVREGLTIRREEQYGSYVSLLPFGGIVKGVTLRGFSYDLTDRDYEYGSSLGISNEIAEEEGRISFESGILLVIEARDGE